MADVRQEVLSLNQKLLDAIADGDWATYQDLCTADLTCLEPESHGTLVRGLAFHRFYFDLGGVRGRHTTTMVEPDVRVMGDVVVVAYIRLVQKVGPDGQPMTAASSETRVWQRIDGRWKHVHFHRSPLA